MKAPAFWRRPERDARAWALWPAAALYGAIAARGMARVGARVAAPVVTVGGFTAGGAGKTPTALALARLAIERGLRPAFVARGHGGALARRGALQVEGQSASAVGDEALLLARVAPTFVGVDRRAAAALAIERARPDLLILDDGLQSRRVEPDLALAVVDGATGLGNGLCLPAGPLRAPLAAQLAHVSALVVIGSGEPGARIAAIAGAQGLPVFRARLTPGPEGLALCGRDVVAFAGIGLPEKFFATLEGLGARLVARRAFADHHVFRDRELLELRALARARDALLVTTEKDAVRLTTQGDGDEAPLALPVRLEFDDESAVAALLAAALALG